jgi:hypothetical protein
MSKEIFSRQQSRMKDAGFYDGNIDGIWGPLSDSAFNALVAAALQGREGNVAPNPGAEVVENLLAWGGALDNLPAFKGRAGAAQAFRDRVFWMAGPDGLDMPKNGASWLMACMAWESNETFSADVRNMAGSGATGLIQFMPSTALPFFYSADQIKRMTEGEKRIYGARATARLAAMTPEDQLNYVFRYFKPWKGRLKNLGDVYMAILWPGGVGQPDTYVLWNKDTRPTTYRQNAGLDINKDGRITRAECLVKVTEKLNRGFEPGRVWSA